MAITAASVEANGWVLRITHTAAAGSFPSYALEPDGVPRVALACVHPGFAAIGGVAVATPNARTLVATKPLRKPVNPASPNTPVLDETDNGNGTVTVRLALSEYVHATETSVVLNVTAGWRSGAAAETGLAVANASTFVAPLPIFRWSDVPYQRRTGVFDLELVAYSHHPNGTAPIAGVKFTVTDGTTVKTYWSTALATSATYADAVRVYKVTVDASVATALSAGLLRCDAEVYPWLGAMRATDPAGTRSMAGLATAGFNTPAQSPFVVAWDPVGARYGGGFAVVDPVNGTTTAAATMVQPTLAGARAIAATAKPRDVMTAIQAGYLVNRTLAAANGQVAQTRSVDGLTIVLLAGVTQVGVTAVTFGIGNPEGWVEIVGDPSDVNPRANCVLQAAAVAASARIGRARYANLSIEMDTVAVFNSSTVYHWVDNVEVRGKAGKEATAANISGVIGAIYYTRSRVWKALRGLNYQSAHRPMLARGCEGSRRIEAIAVLGCTWLSNAVDTFAPAAGTSADNAGAGGWGNQAVGAGSIGSQEDVIIAGNDLRGLTLRAWKPAVVAAATAGIPNTSTRRQVFANNVCERTALGTSTEPMWSMGENDNATISYNIVEGNSFVGERCNIMYGDPLPTTLAETNSQINQAFGNRVANNSFDAAFTKHDAFNDGESATLRGSANGYRPQMIETWSVTYGVGFEGNYDWGRSPVSGNFLFEYFGLRGVQTLNGVPAWPADRSKYGNPTSGGGTYKPPVGSVLIGRALRGSTDRDRTGAIRTVPFASGAVDTPSAAATALVPAKARSKLRSSSPGLTWRATLLPAKSRSKSRSSSPVVAWRVVVLLHSARSRHRASRPVLGRSAILAAATARHAMRDAGVAVLPDLLFTTPRLVRIEGEVRVQIVQPNRLMLVC